MILSSTYLRLPWELLGLGTDHQFVMPCISQTDPFRSSTYDYENPTSLRELAAAGAHARSIRP
jgi:hypothetical protein